MAPVQVMEYEKLAADLRNFEDFFQATLERAATEIERRSATKEHRRAAVKWRLRMAAQLRITMDEADLRRAILDVWGLAQRMDDYFQSPDSQAAFGEHGQRIATAAAKEILESAEKLAREHIPQEVFATAQERIRKFARDNPMTGEFSKQPEAEFSDSAEMTELRRIASVPLAPLTALTGVGQTPASIRELARSADRFTDVAEELPASTRWQLQLLALNLEELPIMQSATASAGKIADSTEQFAKIAEEMPQRWREQAEGLLGTVEDAQPQLQKTLELAQQTASSLEVVSADATKITSGVESASHALKTAADAVTVTVQEIHTLIPDRDDEQPKVNAGVEPGQTTSAASAPHEKDTSFSFQAVTESAVALGETTDKLQVLLADVRGFIDANSAGSQTELGKVLDASVGQFRTIIDHAAKRLAQLLGLLFVLLIVYHLIRMRLNMARPAADS